MKRAKRSRSESSDYSATNSIQLGKRARQDSDWAPSDGEHPNAQKLDIKSEGSSQQSDWETLQVCKVALDCSHVNLKAS